MPETLEAAASDGLNVVRIWALGERASDAPSWTREYSFRLGRGGWVEESFEHLDRVLDEARRLGLRVILVLANRWGDHGGVPQMLRWCGEQRAAAGAPDVSLCCTTSARSAATASFVFNSKLSILSGP